jgi:sulfur-oxidizing protein SoxY
MAHALDRCSVARRRWLATTAGLALVAVVRPAAAAAADLAAANAAFAGGVPVRTGRVTLDVAPLVDNGNSVSVTVAVDSPMTDADHVVAIALFNERNPERDVVRVRLGARARPRFATRIRLATSQQLVAVAQLSDGSFWSHRVDVVVALASCIEGED